MGFFKKIKKFVSELMSLPPEQEIKPQQGSRPAAQPTKVQESAKPLSAIPAPPVAQIEETACTPEAHEAVKAAVKAPSATEKVDTKPHGVTPVGASQNKPREKAAKPVDQKEKPVKQVQDTPALPLGVKISGDYLYHVIKKDNTATILKYVGRSSEKKLVIPAELDGHIVDTIGKAAFSNYKGESYPRLDLKTAQEKYAIAQECTFQGTTIHLPETIETIDDFAFHGAVSLQKVVFPKKMKKIGKYSFYGCSELKTAHFPDELEELAYHSFEDCVKLTDVDLPATLETLQSSTFKGCSALRTLRFPDQLKKIEYSVFENCISLQNVQLPSTLTTVNNNIFKGCSNLSSIELMGSDSESPFYSMDGVLYAKNKRLISYPEGKTDSIFALPEGTTGIDNGGFAGNTHINEVKLPKSFRTIRWRAFNGCNNLEKLELPHRKVLQANEHDFFDGCDKLTVYIQEGSLNEQMIKEINEKLLEKDRRAITYAIIHKDGSTSHPERMLTVSETLDPSGDFQINNKKVLTKYLGKAEHVVIPHGVLEIGKSAFEKNTTIQSVEIPDSVEVIQYAAFSDCHGLLDIHLPDSIAKIEFSAFSSCSALKTARLPSSLRIIDRYTFLSCEQLAKVVIPEGVLEIKESAFSWCKSLQHVSLPTSLVSIEKSAFAGCEALAEVRIPEGITHIEDETFNNCDALNSVIFPETLTSIGDGAFNGCSSLAKVFIPRGVMEIGSTAFAFCDDSLDIYLPDSITRIGASVFMSVYNRTIHTVRGSYAAKYAQENKIEVVYDYPSGFRAVSSRTSRQHMAGSISQPNTAFKEVFSDDEYLDGEESAEDSEHRRVVIDNAFSIVIPENHDYSLDPPGFSMGAVSWEHVLVTVSEGDDIENYHEADEQIAVRLLLSAGILSYTDIQSEEGQGYIDNVVNQLTDDGEIEWEILVDEPDLIVGYLEHSYFQKTHFTAGIFTNNGLYHMTLAYEYGGKAGNDPEVRKVLRSIRPIREEETKTFAGIGEQTGPKALRQTKATPDVGQRILVDNAWSISVPDGFKASVDPDVMGNSLGSRVLAMVPDDMELDNVFGSEDSISASRLPIPMGSFQSLGEPAGRHMMEMVVDTLAMQPTNKWEYLVHREDLVVGFCEDTPYGPTRFVAGVFTIHGFYQVQVFISHGNKESKHKKAREYLQTIREVNEAIADSVSEKPKPKSKPAQKKVTLSMVRSNLDMVKPQGEGYYDFMVKRMAGNWVANLFVDAVQQTGFINLVGDYSIYQMAKLDSPTEAKPYPYTRHAMEMAEVFHNSALPEDEQSSYYTNINKAQIARFEMLELFQSFAWCVHNYSKNTGMPVAELPLETLMLIVKAIEGWENVCYTEDSYCPELCRIMAYNNFFSLHAKSHTQTKEFMQKENLGDEKYGSLKALREELAAIYEPVRKLHSQLAEDKSADELSDNALMAIVSVWCSFAVAANDPFQMRQAKSEEQELPAPDPVEWEKQFDLVGTGYEGRPAAHESLKVGEMVNLVRNPDNIYDSNAIEVFNSAGNSLGHIPGHFAASWAPRLDAGTMEILSAEVTNVVPLSQRTARAKNPLTSILIKYRMTL